LRPKRTAKPPNNYAREQEKEIEQRTTRSQQRKKKQGKPATQNDEPTSDDPPTEGEDLDTVKLVEELTKLRREIRQRDNLHRDELKRVKEEFSAALAEVQHELQTLTLQSHSESCPQSGHEEILREIQSLRDSITFAGPTNNLSYADVARTPPTSQPSNIRTLSSFNTTPTTVTDTLYCMIDTSKMADNENDRMAAGPIRAIVKTEIRTMENHMNW
jgi:small-conductance mechanosensitive channel